MKPQFTLLLFIVFGIFINCCTAQSDLINDEFPIAKQEVIETFEAITKSIKDGDIDQLISYHAYGPKFTEFKNGESRNDRNTNEAHKRSVFGPKTEVIMFEAKNLQIAVYGKVANLTFHSNFHFKFGEELIVVNDQVTLLLVKSNNEWRIVHEHHSPIKTDYWCNILHEHQSP